MKVVQAKAEILRPTEGAEAINAIFRAIETPGRICYKSKDKEVARLENEIRLARESRMLSEQQKNDAISILLKLLYEAQNKSARQFTKRLIEHGHEAMIEHANMAVLFTVDRGVSHELVRHRIASFGQESSRFCNYSQDKFGNEITVIKPCFWSEDSNEYNDWVMAMRYAEQQYFNLLRQGATPEQARSVLPNSLKTEIVVTANMREWRNIFKLRAAGTTGKPHPQMVEVMVPLLKKCQKLMPELFEDIEIQENKE